MIYPILSAISSQGKGRLAARSVDDGNAEPSCDDDVEGAGDSDVVAHGPLPSCLWITVSPPQLVPVRCRSFGRGPLPKSFASGWDELGSPGAFPYQFAVQGELEGCLMPVQWLYSELCAWPCPLGTAFVVRSHQYLPRRAGMTWDCPPPAHWRTCSVGF